MKKILITPLLVFIFTAVHSYADQPVMDMAPRWEKGYGMQIRQEFYGSSKLLDGNNKIDNPLGLERYVSKTWLEGVYTFNRAIRATFKLPFIYQRRVKEINGAGVRQENSGVGDLILGVPLRYYRNKGAYTDNFGITPSIRIPTGDSSGDFPISDGSWDFGLSLSHSLETPKYYTSVELIYWKNTNGKRDQKAGDEYAIDVDLGYHAYHSDITNSGIFTMWNFNARHNGEPSEANLTTFTGGELARTGPILVLYRENVMFRAELQYPIYEDVDGISNSRGPEVNIGIGVAF